MNISLILAHPNKQSFNHAIAQACVHALEEKGHINRCAIQVFGEAKTYCVFMIFSSQFYA
jgi:putative NADPH-quinone reductase